nr:PREDICTED: T-cell immunomodulatory protein-like isoform X2 [Haliaeetus albicilla]
MKSLSVTITSVVPGDYDGDSQMDVLLTTQAQNHGKDELSVFIFWGHNQTLDLNHKTMLNKTFLDEPLVMDFNGDLIPDIFGVTSDSRTYHGMLHWKPKVKCIYHTLMHL